jgi:hypothetical protein
VSGFTLDGIAAAIQAHIDDEAVVNETVVSFVLGIHTAAFEADDPEVHSYWYYTPPHQPNHVTLGLIQLADEWAHSGGMAPRD